MKKFAVGLMMVISPISSYGTDDIDADVRGNIMALVRLKSDVDLASQSLRIANTGAQRVLEDLLGTSRSWLWNKSGLIEKLWSSTTFFKWESAVEGKGDLGALENRKNRFSSQREKEQVIHYHQSVLSALSALFGVLKTQPLWGELMTDPYRLRNHQFFESHWSAFESQTARAQPPVEETRMTQKRAAQQRMSEARTTVGASNRYLQGRLDHYQHSGGCSSTWRDGQEK